jgi:hypothetical protein
MGENEMNSFVTEGLLKALKEERELFTKSDVDLMLHYIDILISRGEYPETTPYIEAGHTHLSLVEGWGVDWYIFKGILECPHCKADLRSPSGPPFKREIYVKDGRGMAPSYLQCPDCNKKI